ncbi:hypothetical protein HYD52_01800 [Mycoplasmopsis bovis]|nr:hypothetical protein HYD52_01800 [Mycoplasmopsis bovis]
MPEVPDELGDEPFVPLLALLLLLLEPLVPLVVLLPSKCLSKLPLALTETKAIGVVTAGLIAFANRSIF